MNLQETFNTPRVKQLAIINAFGALFIFAVFAARTHGPWDAACEGRSIDFQALWGAARLAILNEPLAAFDRLTLRDIYSYCDVPSTDRLYWLYPAPALTLLTPLGLLPFFVAWMVFTAISLSAFAAAVRLFYPPKSPLFALIVFAPALWTALTAGQVSMLWMAGLMAAYSAFRSDRTALAGIFIGLLTLKPTLGLLIPVALIASKNWRAIYYATLTTLVLHGSATLLYGISYWTLWLDVTSQHGQEMLLRMSFFDRDPPIASLSYLITRFGPTPIFAVKCGIVVTAILACIVFAVWRKLGAKSDIAMAVLVAAIPLATPYLWHYDAAFSVIAGLFLLRAHQGPISPPWWSFYIACWIGPGLALANEITLNVEILRPVWTLPPLFLLILVVGVRAAINQPKPVEN